MDELLFRAYPRWKSACVTERPSVRGEDGSDEIQVPGLEAYVFSSLPPSRTFPLTPTPIYLISSQCPLRSRPHSTSPSLHTPHCGKCLPRVLRIRAPPQRRRPIDLRRLGPLRPNVRRRRTSARLRCYCRREEGGRRERGRHR